jgi:homoserine dehydrogenase
MILHEKFITKSDLDAIEKYADKIFAKVGIDIEFTRHFLDRVNDERNQRQITTAELTRLFKQTYAKHGKKIPQMGPDAEAVIKDMKTDINMPFVLNYRNGEFELVAKTIMRKKNFKTPNPELAVESFMDVWKKKKQL